MGRHLRTDVPQVSNLLIPDWPHYLGFQEKDAEYKKQQKEQYDRRHRARPITTPPEDTEVWVTMQDRQVPGRVATSHTTPRSYIVDIPIGQIRRNRIHINKRSETVPSSRQTEHNKQE